MTHLAAMRCWRETHSHLPVRVKFIIEGEEEIGSPNLPGFVREHADPLRCDYVVLSDSTKLDADTAEELRKGYLREDYFTKKRQEDAKARTDALALAAQYEERAKKWENLEADPALQEHLLNFYNQISMLLPCLQGNLPSRRGELEGIIKEIQYDLSQTPPIS